MKPLKGGDQEPMPEPEFESQCAYPGCLGHYEPCGPNAESCICFVGGSTGPCWVCLSGHLRCDTCGLMPDEVDMAWPLKK